MSYTIITPNPAVYSKTAVGLSDMYIQGGVYKFMGASVLSISCTIGFNGTPSSMNITLVQDISYGDEFVEPTIPSLWAFCLPQGGVGNPIFYRDGYQIVPTDYNFDGTPFYFCGVCTNWTQSLRDVGGNTINVTLVDPRELLTGVQCLLNGFALSQDIGAGSSRYTGVLNVIDVFGYYDYGLTSGRSPYGTTWSEIQTVLEAVQVTINGLNFEFHFTGNTYSNVPSFYRIPDTISDVVALAQKVAQDGGSDFVIIARKTAPNACVVEFRGIQRTNANPLTQGDIAAFISERSSIVESAKQGREYRNEPTSSIIIGGFQNSMYTALPSTYVSGMHLSYNTDTSTVQENYNLFPPDIKVRLFGGSGVVSYTVDTSDGEITTTSGYFNVSSGAILPFWGFTPDDHAYPLIEPFLPLDHLAFDRISTSALTYRIPVCMLTQQNFTVRNVTHQQMFISGDNMADSRPFAMLSGYMLNDSDDTTVPSGWMRGLPLNTEVLRAAMFGNQETFYGVFNMFYPDIAGSLGFPLPDFKGVLARISNIQSGVIDIRDLWETIAISTYDYTASVDLPGVVSGITVNPDNNGHIFESTWAAIGQIGQQALLLPRFHQIIYELVKQYGIDNMGKRFIACLPASPIMQRIWAGLSVPTNTNRPDIEYVVDNRGYWNYLPLDVDVTTTSGNFTLDEKDQITRKFMAEDNRFYGMVGIDWKPSGNMNFLSDNLNKAMFQDFEVNDFRPNRIASANPSYVLATCSVSQLSKRPDLALVELPNAIEFQPQDTLQYQLNSVSGINDTFIANKIGIVNYLEYLFNKNNDFLYIMQSGYASPPPEINGFNYYQYKTYMINYWAEKMQTQLTDGLDFSMRTEYIMDLKGIIIPLTSTWVSYGPWYSNYNGSPGMVSVIVDDGLVPWNFNRPSGIMLANSGVFGNLNQAGQERLASTICNIDYVDNAVITVAGFPEYGLASSLGYNSNITAINVDFGINGIKTIYSLSTYAAKPGTYRKYEYDDVNKARIDLREKLPQPINDNIIYDVFAGKGGNIFGVDRFQQ